MFRRLTDKPLRLPRLRPYIPNPKDPAIFWFNSERSDIVREVVARVLEGHKNSEAMTYTLNDAALHESRRLASQDDDEAKESLQHWRKLTRRIGKLSEQQIERELNRHARYMAEDVAGNFDPRVYRFSTRFVPHLLTGVMQPSRLPSALLASSAPPIDHLLGVEGPFSTLKSLAELGTLVFVPTHSSNLDSIVLAQALHQSGLPPVIYGAGKNLFTNPIMSFFMHNLGAYRVDRRVRAKLYKQVLKAYSAVMIERGYHSLFFPGGTRSRSGMIERHLKLGLAGSAVDAFTRNHLKRIPKRVFFVPTTINYELVLEAETLISDWLIESGKARYIIDDDEFSRVDRWVSFFRKMGGLESACIIRFGEPLDPFGNQVTADGSSTTPDGRLIDPSTYVSRGEEVQFDAQRNQAYTRELSAFLLDSYRRNTILMSTQVVAHVLYRHVVIESPALDVFARSRLRGEVSVPYATAVAELSAMQARLRTMERDGVVRLSQGVRQDPAEKLIQRALSAWDGYHDHTAARREGDAIICEDPRLLLFYQNRLVPFAMEANGDEHPEATQEIAAMELRS